MDAETSCLFFTLAWVLVETLRIRIRIECPLGVESSKGSAAPALQMQLSMGCCCYNVFANRHL